MKREMQIFAQNQLFFAWDTRRRLILLCRFKRRTDHLHVNHRFNLGVILLWYHTIVPAISDWGIQRANHSRTFTHMLFRFIQPGKLTQKKVKMRLPNSLLPNECNNVSSVTEKHNSRNHLVWSPGVLSSIPLCCQR